MTEEKERKTSWLEKAPLLTALLAIGLCLIYWLAFKELPKGGPDSWGQFGDFLGGILNPVVGLCTLLVAVAVLKLQQRELEATKLALQEQVEQTQKANSLEIQKKDEQLFMSIMDKVSSSAFKITDGMGGRLQGSYIEGLAGDIWNKNLGSGTFADAYRNGIQVRIDEIAETYRPHVENYVHLVVLALQLIDRRLPEPDLFSALFSAQIGQQQLSLLCYLSCASQYSELKLLIQKLRLIYFLPKNQRDAHIEYKWFSA